MNMFDLIAGDARSCQGEKFLQDRTACRQEKIAVLVPTRERLDGNLGELMVDTVDFLDFSFGWRLKRVLRHGRLRLSLRKHASAGKKQILSALRG